MDYYYKNYINIYKHYKISIRFKYYQKGSLWFGFLLVEKVEFIFVSEAQKAYENSVALPPKITIKCAAQQEIVTAEIKQANIRNIPVLSTWKANWYPVNP